MPIVLSKKSLKTMEGCGGSASEPFADLFLKKNKLNSSQTPVVKLSVQKLSDKKANLHRDSLDGLKTVRAIRHKEYASAITVSNNACVGRHKSCGRCGLRHMR